MPELDMDYGGQRLGGVGRAVKPCVKYEETVVNKKEGGERCELENGGTEREDGRGNIGSLSPAVPEEKGESELPREAATMTNSKTHKLIDLMHINPTAPFRLQHELADDLPHHTHDHTHNHAHHSPTDTTKLVTNSEDNLSSWHDATVTQQPHPLPGDSEAKSLSSGSHKNIKNGFHHHQRNQVHCSPCRLKVLDLEEARRSVDLRMIDFAHSTHKGYSDTVQYVGPDEGYAIGLSSLIDCFERMIESASSVS